ncbi:ABC transporter ATP-binding protein [Streptomyces sp. DSM 44915]|uniref:ABC transporter ATP-binding protein n=1 Tax=Streptomyces chisholmiae TaxID=3075540 RepID=A0ABU2JY10_9ACTN|nr:ABC transporter ATP-binding protein [Streptomyces sp. DSM 44915]MDT0269837.1 ABC transporter ATP-binding protein [Streptomyces sp. DSM 44915]
MNETTRGPAVADKAATTDEPYLELRGVTVRHGERTVVSGIDLTLRPGEFLALLGPSGCGKSSLLQVLAGLARVAGGSLRLDGADATEGLGQRVRVGYVFQDHRLLPWRTVGQNIEIAMKAAGVPKAEWDERIDRFLSMLRVAEHRTAWPMRLSGGQRQRVSIARALAVDPDIVLMDEPFSGLDEVTARAMRQELTRLHETTAVPTLFVTHSIREALFLADRVVILSQGPARVLKTLDVPLVRPRRHEDSALTRLADEVVADVLREWEPTEGPAS